MMNYSEETLAIIDDLYDHSLPFWSKQAYNVRRETHPYQAIIASDDYGQELYRYEFLTDEDGNWNRLRCSGSKSAHERESMQASDICFGRKIAYIGTDSSCPDRYVVWLDKNVSLRSLSDYQKTAVCQAMCQLMICDIYGGRVEADDPSIDIVMRHFGIGSQSMLDRLMSATIWNRAMDMSPFEAFSVVSQLPALTKNEIRSMIDEIVRETRTSHRQACLPTLLRYCEL